MLDVRYSTQFKRDFTASAYRPGNGKACVKRRCNMELLQEVIDRLRVPEALPPKNRNHNLSGMYSSYMECHIAPDWLLIYRIDETELLLYRTGTHSDLF